MSTLFYRAREGRRRCSEGREEVKHKFIFLMQCLSLSSCPLTMMPAHHPSRRSLNHVMSRVLQSRTWYHSFLLQWRGTSSTCETTCGRRENWNWKDEISTNSWKLDAGPRLLWNLPDVLITKEICPVNNTFRSFSTSRDLFSELRKDALLDVEQAWTSIVYLVDPDSLEVYSSCWNLVVLKSWDNQFNQRGVAYLRQ